MKKEQFLVERDNFYKNIRQFWNGATWVNMRNTAIPFTNDEALKLVKKFNRNEKNYEFVFRLEKVSR